MKTKASESTVSGLRVALRLLSANDATALANWLPEAVALSQGEKKATDETKEKANALLTPGTDGIMAIAMREDDNPLGVIAYDANDEDWLTLTFIAIRVDERRRGLGGEAVYAFEEEVTRRGLMRRFRTPVHINNGLGVYFWLRVGYRPARSSDFDMSSKGSNFWMVRAD